MSISEEVIRRVEATPGATVDDLVSMLPYTRDQILGSLHQASFYGALRCERQPALGRGKGAKPGRYYAANVPKPRVFIDMARLGANSIFQMGERAGACA